MVEDLNLRLYCWSKEIDRLQIWHSYLPPNTVQYCHSTLFFVLLSSTTVLLWTPPLESILTVPILDISLLDTGAVLSTLFTIVLVLFSLTATLVATWLRHRSICPTIVSLFLCLFSWLNGKSLRNLSWPDIVVEYWASQSDVYRVKATNHPITLVEQCVEMKSIQKRDVP